MRSRPPQRKKRQRSVRIGNGVEIAKANKILFKDAARDQRCCQMCNSTTREWDAHHVVYEQHLVRAGEPAYSTPNALRLCRDCHGKHHKREVVIPVSKLLDHNIDYAFVALGPAAYDYLARYYGGTDARVETALKLAEEAA